jgi:hypothetical protein
MARKRRFRFGLPIVFAGRPSVGGVGLGCRQIRFAAAARFGALGSVLPDSVLSDSKSPRRMFRRGLNSCDDEDMPVICPDVAPFLSVSRRGFYHLRGAMGSGTQDPSRKVEALIVNPTRQEPRER